MLVQHTLSTVLSTSAKLTFFSKYHAQIIKFKQTAIRDQVKLQILLLCKTFVHDI